MIVDQIEAFKSWLTAVLKPMCEADPAALAKYVLALIKKDKSEAELRKSMVGQLEVFLEGETENFVNLVFQTLTTKDYITTPVIPNANPPNPITPTKPKEGRETKVIVPPSELPNLNEVVNGNTSEKKEVKKDVKSRRNSENGVSSKDKEERPARRRSRHRSLSRNRTKSRSRSWDRVKRSRSRDKSRDRVDRVDRESHRLDREKRDRGIERDRVRPWRNKSPTRRYDRRRSRSPRSSSPPRLRSRSRSPRHSHRNRYRGSRSRSRSIEKKDRKDPKDVKNQSRPGTPIQDSNHTETDLVVPGTQTVPSVVVQPNASKRRCRDFDEKGYCMRGEMCPFDHGIDPVVLEDSTLTRVLSYNPNGDVTGALAGGAPITGVPIPPGTGGPPRHPVDNPYNPQAPQMWSGGRFRGPRPMGGVRLPGINPFSQPPPVIGLQRELIPVPLVMDNIKPPGVPAGGYAPAPGGFGHHPGSTGPPQPYGPGGIPISHHGLESSNMHSGMFKKKFDFNRLGPRKNPGNCSLELKKVPTGMNTITHLNNHFSKFGKIINIQVNYEGDAEAALITFSNHAEANSAYRSTEAVLNNRFIKLFWHDADSGKQENVPPVQQNALKDRLGNVAPNSNKVLNLLQPKAEKTENENKDEKGEIKPELSKEETKAQATAAIQKNQDFLAVQAKMNKNKDEQRKEVLKIQSNLRKRKQELLDKQLSQQKILVDKMSKLPPGPQRDVIKETIKKTQEAIEGIKKDLELAALTAKNAVVGATKSKEETQKELLDMELDLIAKQQEGTDTSELLKKMNELKAKTAFTSRPIRGLGRGRFTPIASRHLLVKHNFVDNNFKLTGKIKTVTKIVNNAAALTPSPVLPLAQVASAVPFQKHTVDHRPTRLLVSGYETDEQEAVVTHFQQFGEVVDYSIDSSLPSITLNYKTRKEAESALLKGKHFQDRTLSITWQSGPPNRLQTQKSGGSSTRAVLLSESDEDHLIDQSLLEGDEELGPETEEALLQDDEEEDEEDRSWRR